MDKVIGSEIKIKVTITDIDNCRLSQTKFLAEFYTNDYEGHNVPLRYNSQSNTQVRMVDDDTFVAVFSSTDTGVGRVRVKMTIDVPDTDCADGWRTEILRGSTDINIIE